MNFIKNNWLLILILVVLAIVVYRYWQKTKIFKEEQLPGNINIPNVVNNSSSSSSNNNSNSNTNTGTTYTPPPAPTYSYDSFKIGDKLYAGDSGANAYLTPVIASNNIKKYFSKNQFVGTFLALEGNFIKVLMQELNTNTLTQLFQPIINTEVYFSKFNNQVYKK